MVGGPLDGAVEAVDGYWPFVAKKFDGDYHLTYCVVADNAIAPYTPLIYVWGGFQGDEAQQEAEAYIALHAEGGGLLADYELIRLTSAGVATHRRW